mgnify:CR=1 FL=1
MVRRVGAVSARLVNSTKDKTHAMRMLMRKNNLSAIITSAALVSPGALAGVGVNLEGGPGEAQPALGGLEGDRRGEQT